MYSNQPPGAVHDGVVELVGPRRPGLHQKAHRKRRAAARQQHAGHGRVGIEIVVAAEGDGRLRAPAFKKPGALAGMQLGQRRVQRRARCDPGGRDRPGQRRQIGAQNLQIPLRVEYRLHMRAVDDQPVQFLAQRHHALAAACGRVGHQLKRTRLRHAPPLIEKEGLNRLQRAVGGRIARRDVAEYGGAVQDRRRRSRRFARLGRGDRAQALRLGGAVQGDDGEDDCSRNANGGRDSRIAHNNTPLSPNPDWTHIHRPAVLPSPLPPPPLGFPPFVITTPRPMQLSSLPDNLA